MLIEAWEWAPTDRTVLALPLHHVHGLINVVAVGDVVARDAASCCRSSTPRRSGTGWRRARSRSSRAVPTIYHQLIASWDAAPARRCSARDRRVPRRPTDDVADRPRCPVRTLERWREITGHTLLERYGMTEIGMALSNPLKGERRAGFVGAPLPERRSPAVGRSGRARAGRQAGRNRGPRARRVSRVLAAARRDRARRFATAGSAPATSPSATKARTACSADRASTSSRPAAIKVSALEIEDVLREHPAGRRLRRRRPAGRPSGGSASAAAVELRARDVVRGGELRGLGERSCSRRTRCRASCEFVPALPRNAMGKVVKNGADREARPRRSIRAASARAAARRLIQAVFDREITLLDAADLARDDVLEAARRRDHLLRRHPRSGWSTASC